MLKDSDRLSMRCEVQETVDRVRWTRFSWKVDEAGKQGWLITPVGGITAGSPPVEFLPYQATVDECLAACRRAACRLVLQAARRVELQELRESLRFDRKKAEPLHGGCVTSLTPNVCACSDTALRNGCAAAGCKACRYAASQVCAGCGEPWPCSDAQRRDINGIERAKHYVANPNKGEFEIVGPFENEGSIEVRMHWAKGKTSTLIFESQKQYEGFLNKGPEEAKRVPIFVKTVDETLTSFIALARAYYRVWWCNLCEIEPATWVRLEYGVGDYGPDGPDQITPYCTKCKEKADKK